MSIINGTSFTADHFFFHDEQHRPLLVCILKATFAFSGDGSVTVADNQDPIYTTDSYSGSEGQSSIAYASDLTLGKPETDVVLTGKAYSSPTNRFESFITLRVGSLRKHVLISGRRTWKRVLGSARISSPQPFDCIPITYENAYGGVDESHHESRFHERYIFNPVGKGFFAKKTFKKLSGMELPHFENPEDLISSPDERPQPQGTFDDKWHSERMPLYPVDFNRSFFNAAHPDLIYPGYLKGGEPVEIQGTFRNFTNPVCFELPVIKPQCIVEADGFDTPQALQLHIETVHLDTENMRLILVTGAAMRIDHFLAVRRSVFTTTINQCPYVIAS